MALAHTVPDLLASLLRTCGHPDIADAASTATPGVRADLRDGSRNYFAVAHVGKAGDRPGKPSWPGHQTAGGGR